MDVMGRNAGKALVGAGSLMVIVAALVVFADAPLDILLLGGVLLICPLVMMTVMHGSKQNEAPVDEIGGHASPDPSGGSRGSPAPMERSRFNGGGSRHPVR